MVIYNVTVKIENDIAGEWVSWMKAEHMPDVMGTGLFLGCRLCRLLEQDDTDGITYSAQYECGSIDEYRMYIDIHAGAMREKFQKLYAGKFVAFRSVMEII